MQKKSITLITILLLAILTACSGNQEPDTTDNVTVPETTVASNQTTDSTEQQSTTVVQAAQNNPTPLPTLRPMPTPIVLMPQTGRADYDAVDVEAEQAPLDLALGQPMGDTSSMIVISGANSNGADGVAAVPPAEPIDPNAPPVEEEGDDGEVAPDMQFEDYGVNPFVDTAQDNLSTFAMDVDTGSYTLARNYLVEYGQMPPAPAIRPEEFINYFPQDYETPTDGAFAINMDAAPSPFSDDNQILLRVGIQGRVVAAEDRDPALLIFVIDVSGSMSDTNRLELAKDALEILVGELREDDRVGIVVYSNEARIVLEPTPASEQERIISAIDALQTEGSTYAEAGLALAYDVAQAHMRDGQTTRVILVSDGVANVGATGPEAILETISEGVDSGITLSTIGVGMGNFNDVMMEQLANDGNGNCHYVDNIREARRIFVNNLTSTLQVIGYDARIQVEFNPDVVARYRLIGYENRDIADQDFRNDTIDAGEVGAGHTITALYEVELIDNAQSGTIATTYIRYEDADLDEVVEINQDFALDAVLQSFDDAPIDFQITAAVAEFSEILRESPYGTSDYEALLAVVEPYAANYPAAADLVAMIEAAIRLG